MGVCLVQAKGISLNKYKSILSYPKNVFFSRISYPMVWDDDERV
jgi:hypothetical protein